MAEPGDPWNQEPITHARGKAVVGLNNSALITNAMRKDWELINTNHIFDSKLRFEKNMDLVRGCVCER